MDLLTYLKSLKKRKPARFQVMPIYESTGDSISVFMEDKPYYAAPLTEEVTLFRSMKTARIIGFQINGIKEIIR